MQQLEQMLEYKKPLKQTIDTYATETIILYTPMPKPPGLTPLGGCSPGPGRPADSFGVKDHIQYGPDNTQRGPYGNVTNDTPILTPRPINPILDGGLELDLNKSTPNTIVIKEEIYPLKNIYFHHDGRQTPGRMETITKFKKPIF